MAHELDQSVRVHQALHGYEDGHRLIASSTSLRSRDQKTMLIMSDVSGAGANLEATGYLTGYPLADSGFYAVARTWAATEMARPGCVWTHTLLVDFADLANLSAMNFLDRAFRRPPTDLDLNGYMSPLTIEKDSSDPVLPKTTRESLKRVMYALYGFPRDKIISTSDGDSSLISFLVWAQQWPRLRRSFRFCTLAFADRSSEGAQFDLQFTPLRDRSIRSRFNDTIDADKKDLSESSWLEEALDDVSRGKDGRLRKFLKDVGGDIAGGREMFVPLCMLHRMIPRFGADSGLIDNAIELIDSAFDSASAGSLRSLLFAAVARHPESLNDRSADFLLTHISLLNEISLDHAQELGQALWLKTPDRMLDLIQSTEPQATFAKKVIDSLNKVKLFEVIKQQPYLLSRLLEHRPDLLSEPDIWSVQGDWVQNIPLPSGPDAGSVLTAILKARRSDLAFKAERAFGSTAILRTVSSLLTEGKSSSQEYSAWFDVAMSHPSTVSEFLTTEPTISMSLLLAIATRTQPDTLPNEIGADPWATAVEKSSGRLDEKSQQFLAGYLLARAFGYRSNSQTDLVAYGFDEVYFGALRDRLAENAWELLQRALPRSWFSEWDRCQKLRDAITDLFVNRDLPAEGFTRITRDISVFNELARITSYNSRGRKYLKKVRGYLEASGGSRSMIEIIEKAI